MLIRDVAGGAWEKGKKMQIVLSCNPNKKNEIKCEIPVMAIKNKFLREKEPE